MRNIAKYTDDYLKPNFEDYQVGYRRKKILEVLLSGEYVHSNILEIGCGMEPLFESLSPSDYKSYYVVEPSDAFYENAVKVKNGNDQITCIHGFFPGDYDFKSKNIDFIICASLLHETEDPGTFIREIKNVCSSHTTVHINVPNANSFHRLLAVHMGLIKDTHEFGERNRLYQQHNVFDLPSLCQICEEEGLSVVDKGSYFIKPFTHSQMYQMMENGIIDTTTLDGLYELGKKIDLGSEIYVNLRAK